MHEAQMHKHNCFVTLTYRPEDMPADGNLDHRHVQLFLKQLRNTFNRQPHLFLQATGPQGQGVGEADGSKAFKYYMCGEYGEQFQRPHYHLCLFGIEFQDKKYLRLSSTSHKLYISETLKKLWPHGYSSIGAVSFQTAAYIARYVLKKITGTQSKKHYEKIDAHTGEIIKIEKEYNQMSRRPGIGKTWLEKYTTDIYPHGQMIVRGKKTNTPRAYDKWYAQQQPLNAEQLAYARYIEGLHHRENQTPERLKVREQVQAAQLQQLKRKI